MEQHQEDQAMKFIPLTKNMCAMVDDDDYDDLMQHKWHASAKGTNGDKFYAYSHLGSHNNERQSMQQYLMPNAAEIDHCDGNGLNNQRHNMRVCTRSQNVANARFRVGASGYRGVRLAYGGKFVAQLVHNNQHTHLGTFATAEEAARAWDEAAKTHHGEFAMLNFPEDNTT
jgi:hypothetical protein